MALRAAKNLGCDVPTESIDMAVFEQRKDFMAQESVRETIDEMRHGVIDDIVTRHIPPDAYPEQWDIEGLKEAVANFLNLELPVAEWAKEEGIADEEMRERLRKAADESYAERVEKNSAEVMNYVEKQVLLQSLDHLWREHLVTLEHLRQVIGYRGYAQRVTDITTCLDTNGVFSMSVPGCRSIPSI